MGLWSHVLSPLWLLSPLSFVVSAVASSSTSLIYDHISCTARVVFHSLRVVHLTTNWPSCFHSLCIRLYASDFSCDYPRYTNCFSTAQHPCIPAVDLFSRVFTPTVVCDLASGRLFYFFCLLSTALNTSSCESFAVFHTISRAVLIYETSQPQKPKWFASSMGEMFHRSNWLLMWSYHILTGNGKQERVSRDFSVPTVAHVRGFGCFEFASVWMFYLGSVCFLVLVVFYCWFWYLCHVFCIYIYI